MRWRRFFERRRRDEEFAREIDAYLAHETDDGLARGLTPAEARHAARRKFGNPVLIREELYMRNSLPWLDRLSRDLRYGVRQLAAHRGYTLTAILSLALGIGANTAIFQLLDAIRLRSLPIAAPDRLAQIRIEGGNRGFGSAWGNYEITGPLWREIHARQQAFADVFAWSTTNFQLGDGAAARPIRGLWVSGDTFPVLGLQPHRGRLLGPADDRAGCGTGPIVISYALWQREFGGREEAIGSRVILSERPFTVVGVTPPEFFGLEVGRSFDAAAPLCSQYAFNRALEARHIWQLNAMGRLRPGDSLATATASLTQSSAGWFEAVTPTGYPPEALVRWNRYRLLAIPAGHGVSDLRQDYEGSLWVLLGITGLVLLIACANLANLMLARAAAREREMAVRLAIGASRGHLVIQLLAESLLLVAAGGVLALAVGRGLSHALVLFLTTKGNGLHLDLATDWRVVGFTAASALATCLLFGLAPALQAGRTPLAAAIQAGGRSSTAGRRQLNFQHLLIVAQVALSLILVVGAGLFVRSFVNLLTMDTGFTQRGLAFAFVDFSRLKPSREAMRPLQAEILNRIRAIPGIAAAATTSNVPLSGARWVLNIRTPGTDRESPDSPQFTWISPGYLKTMAIPLLAGRDLTEADMRSATKAVLVNQAFVDHYLAGRSPLGQRLESLAEPGYPADAYEIVGVTGNTKYAALRDPMPPIVYVPEGQNPNWGPGLSTVLRAELPPAEALRSVRGVLDAAYPGVRIQTVVFAEMVGERLARERLLAWLAGFFGLLALGLAMVGLYGVIAYAAARRETEIGIRLALGATRGHVIRLFLIRAAALLAAGVALGGLGAAFGARLAATLLYGVRPGDPATLAAASLLLLVVAAAAAGWPAWRASGRSPLTSLRTE